MSKLVQNINLYLPEFRRKKPWLDGGRVLLLMGLSIVALALVSGAEYWQLAQLRADRLLADTQAQQATTATAALVEEFDVQTEDLSLLDGINELEAELQSKQILLNFLEGHERGNTEGFSEHLADLSRYHVDGLALTQVSLADGGRSVRLVGQVVKAELVPLYLQNLSKGATYSGTSFERLQISDSPLAFARPDTSGASAVWNFDVRSGRMMDTQP